MTHLLCGTLNIGSGHSDIVCNPDTGELIFCDSVMGNCVLSNLNVESPLSLSSSQISQALQQNPGHDGIIVTGDGIYLLDVDESHEITVNMYSFANGGSLTVVSDLNVEYEEDID